MIGFLSRITGLTPLGLRAAGAFAAALLAVGLWFGLQAYGAHRQHVRDVAAAQVAVAEAKARDAAAKAVADEQRARDAAQAAATENALRNSYANLPDGAPSGVRLALECRRVRDAGLARSAEFSRLCGPPPGAQAGTHH